MYARCLQEKEPRGRAHALLGGYYLAQWGGGRAANVLSLKMDRLLERIQIVPAKQEPTASCR